MLANLKLSSEVHPGRDFYFLILQNKNRPPPEKRSPHKSMVFFTKKGVILAKKPTGGLTRGEKKKIKSLKWQKNLLHDLPGVKRRKFEEKWQKNLLEDLSGGKGRQLRVKMAKNTYWRTYLGGKRKIMGKNGKKNTRGRRTRNPYKPNLGLSAPL